MAPSAALPAKADCHCGGTCGGCSGDSHDHAPSGLPSVASSSLMGFYVAPQGAKGHCGRPTKRPSVPHYGGSSMRVPEIARAGGGGYNQPGPRLPSPPPVMRMGGGQPNLDRDRPKSGGGTPGYVQRPSKVPSDNGMALRMPRAADLPSDNGGVAIRMPPPPAKQDGDKPGRPKQPSVELVPFNTPLVPDKQTTTLNPMPRPGCEDPRLAGTELCAGTITVTPSCRDLITNFLRDNPSAVPTDILAMLGTGGQWELCAGEIRAALQPAGTKASSGMYGTSGALSPKGWMSPVVIQGMPHGGVVRIGGYPLDGRWLDAGLTQWLVYGPQHSGIIVGVMDASGRNREGVFKIGPSNRTTVVPYSSLVTPGTKVSGGMPNYWRASGLGLVDPGEGGTYGGASSWTQGGPADLGSGGYIATASDWTSTANPAIAAVPATPPVDYGRLIAGIGTAVGGVFQGVNTAVANAQTARLRELELQYANEGRNAALALQRLALENQNAIATLSAQGTPAASAMVTALQQQNADLSARINAAAAADAAKMSTGTTVALVVGGVALAGALAYLALKK